MAASSRAGFIPLEEESVNVGAPSTNRFRSSVHLESHGPKGPNPSPTPDQEADNGEEKDEQFIIVDEKDEANPTMGTDPIPIVAQSDKEIYWKHVAAGKPSVSSGDFHPPVPILIIMFGPPGCGKTLVHDEFFKERNWSKEDFVLLDPDLLRLASKEYRKSLSGAHAVKLLSVKRQYGDRLRKQKCTFTLGEKTWVENGYTVDGKHLALATSAVRSSTIVRQAMLWGYQMLEPSDAFTDRAFKAGHNIIYDTMGNEPNKFLRELMRRARSHHKYKVVVVGTYAPYNECLKRCQRRGHRSGRIVGAEFLKREYKKMYGGPSASDVDMDKHFDAFGIEMQEGDERYLYDNGEHMVLPKLVKSHVTSAAEAAGNVESKAKEEERKEQKLMEGDKGTYREESTQRVKGIRSRLNIWTGERNDMCIALDMLNTRWKRMTDKHSEKSALRKQIDKATKELESKEASMVKLMESLLKEEPFVLAKVAFYSIVERLEDRDPKMRHMADLVLERIRSLQTNLLDDSECEELTKELADVPKRLFNNLADGSGYEPKLTESNRRRILCRMPTVQICMIHSVGNATWLLTRMSHPNRSKASTVIEYFERLADLRKLMGTDERREIQLDSFYRRLGTQLALPPRKWNTVYTLFPTLYAMRKDRIRVIDALIGTSILSHPLNVLVGQPCALGVLVVDFVAICYVLVSTYRVAIAVAVHNHERRLAETMAPPGGGGGSDGGTVDVLSHDLVNVYIASTYVLAREVFSIFAFHSLGNKTQIGSFRTITVWTYLRNGWKQLNVLSALVSLTFCYVSSDVSLVDMQIVLASWAVGMLWLRLLGFIRTLNINFATYVTCLLQIVKDICWFLIIMGATMIMFGSMLFIWNIKSDNVPYAFKPSWEIEEKLVVGEDDYGSEKFDNKPFMTAFETLLTMYRTILGETHRYWFHDPFEIGVYVVYELVVVILMLNVLIAVVGDSYEYSIIRARTTFVECRVELVVELETLGLTDPGRKDSEGNYLTLFGRINGTVRVLNLRLNSWITKTLQPAKAKDGDGYDSDESDEEDDEGEEEEAPQRKPSALGKLHTVGMSNRLTAFGGARRSTRKSLVAKTQDPDEKLDHEEVMQEELEKPAGGFLGLLQRLIYMDDYDSASLRDINTSDSWLGRALDMERRTAKIVSMAETNIEDNIVGKVEGIQRDVDKLTHLQTVLLSEHGIDADDELSLMVPGVAPVKAMTHRGGRPTTARMTTRTTDGGQSARNTAANQQI